MSNNIEMFYDVELERQCLNALLIHNDILYHLPTQTNSSIFRNKEHAAIFEAIRCIVESGKKPDKINVAIFLKNAGIQNFEELSISDYLNILNNTSMSKDTGVDCFKNLFTLKVKYDTLNNLRDAANFLKKSKDLSASDILNGVDSIVAKNMSAFSSISGDNSVDLFGTLEKLIEDRRLNPPDESKLMMGPFDSINELFGSLSRPGAMTVIGARTGIGKTSLGLFYNTYLAVKYNIPVMHMDNGEMTAEELQFRLMCAQTGGQVPVYALENGDWAKNKTWNDLVRSVFPKIKNIKFSYVPCAELNARQTIASIRRFYLNKVGRGNPMIVNYDYLKPFDTTDKFSPEWKEMGHFIQDLKSFITNEVPLPVWTSLQLNRSGITTNKSSAQVDDSENSFGISDRIAQQSTHSFILRSKLNDEIAQEGNITRWGNLKLIPVKYRFLGRDPSRVLSPVEVADRQYKRNYINIRGDSFHFSDCGDLVDMVEELGENYDLRTAAEIESDDQRL